MRTIVAHQAADYDALLSMFIIRRFLPKWEDAELDFVPAGSRLEGFSDKEEIIEEKNGDEVIHVDTGLGPLDHHQSDDMNLCAAKLTFDFVLENSDSPLHHHTTKKKAVRKMVDFAIDVDHFQELFYPDPNSDIHDLNIIGLIDGYKMAHGFDDHKLAEFVFEAFDSLVHTLENKIFALEELEQSGSEFDSSFGRGFAVETVNDATMKHALKLGYDVVVRRDPNHGFIRIKARPEKRDEDSDSEKTRDQIDLTRVYKSLRKKDPDATWFLHASKRMLLNGSSKNPKSRPSSLGLDEVVRMLS